MGISDSYVGGFCSPRDLVKPEMDLFPWLCQGHLDPPLCPHLSVSLSGQQPPKETALV